MNTLSPARQYLADAQAALAAAGEKHQANHARLQALNAITLRAEPIRIQIAEVEAAHAAALSEWASNGATGDSPAAPATLTKLTNALAVAEREAAAAQTAAKAFEPQLAETQAAADAALANLRNRRINVLYEIAAPLIAEYHQAALKTNSLREHLAGLAYVGPDLIDENRGLSGLFMAINDAIRFQPTLEPGGAEASRQAWRDLIAELGGDPNAELAPAPASIDPDARIRKPFVPFADTDRDARNRANLRGAA